MEAELLSVCLNISLFVCVCLPVFVCVCLLWFVWFLRITNLEKRLADLCGGRAAEQTLFFSHGNLLHLDRPPLIFNQCHFLSTPQSRLLSVQNEDILQQKSSRRNNHCRKWKRDFHILGRIQPNIGLKNLNPIYHFKRTIFFIFGDL